MSRLAGLNVTYFIFMPLKWYVFALALTCLLLKHSSSQILKMSFPLDSLASPTSHCQSVFQYALVFLKIYEKQISYLYSMSFFNYHSILVSFTNKFLDSIVYAHCLYFESQEFLNPLQTCFLPLLQFVVHVYFSFYQTSMNSYSLGHTSPLLSYIYGPYSHMR